ncbi:MAG: hypothetical protein HY235_23995 [Acidobacteria bacterium]|nr:hypothetical protein [Acidobacteriota bacterium]
MAVKVKADKRAEFDGIVKKMVAANRQHKGVNWTASGTVYGDRQTVYFTVSRPELCRD